MRDVEKSGALTVILSFFLGLLLTTFIGVGVYTFCPPPAATGSQAPVRPEGLADIDWRLRTLEDRLDRAARALAIGNDHSRDKG